MEKYRQPFHDKIPNGDKILDQLKYQQKKNIFRVAEEEELRTQPPG